MQITNFRDMYVCELQELRSVEVQLAEALEHMAGIASNPTLKNGFMRHREETLVHQQRLEELLQRHGVSADAHEDQSMQALVHETEKMMSMVQGSELRDAALIASAQKVEHYEIAAYGTAAALAGQLELRDDQKILHQTLEEERRTDELLTKVAKQEVNPEAVALQ
jgi:ferritin-like metal-binding protein YciE